MRKHFTTSILLWVRTDQPRQKGMDHWKGPDAHRLSRLLAPAVSAIRAYDVAATLTFVENGRVLADGDYAHR
jgi:hypothetical protein